MIGSVRAQGITCVGHCLLGQESDDVGLDMLEHGIVQISSCGTKNATRSGCVGSDTLYETGSIASPRESKYARRLGMNCWMVAASAGVIRLAR